MNSNFTFGIYASGDNTTAQGEPINGPRDDHEKANAALDTLQQDTSPLLVRAYIDCGQEDGQTTLSYAPQKPEILLQNGRKLDLVLSYKHTPGHLDEWRQLINDVLDTYGDKLAYLQLTEEPNMPYPITDGYYEGVMDALVEGVVFAKKMVQQRHLAVHVGFNVAYDDDGDATFWRQLRKLATTDFYAALDYVGIDIFPDVFEPSDEGIAHDIVQALDRFRHTDLIMAGINESIPLRITENGWPTYGERTEEAQAKALQEAMRAVYENRNEYHVTHYGLFGLRDADSSVRDDALANFGIMRDDYTPKQAFSAVQELIKNYSTS